MTLLEQLITSFIASAAFVVIFNAQKSSLIQGGIVGMVSWFIYYMMVNRGGYDSVAASLVASFFVAVISQLFSRIYKTPVIVFIVAGIIPLVPGGLAYETMRNFVENDYNTGVALATKTLLISGAIALGLIFSEVINQVIRKSRLSLQMYSKSKR